MSNENALIDFVQDELARGNELKGLSLTDNLIETGILDSLGIMKLILFMEEKLSVKITDEDLIPENFQSIQTINSLVQKKMAGVTVMT
jgi:acyl carrier protein